jgi:hypothetical protein
MALTAEQDEFVARVGGICKKLLEMQTDTLIVNELWFGSTDWDTLITEQDILDMPALAEAGLTKQRLADAIYQAEQVRQLILTGNLPAVVLLSQFA